MSHLKQHWRWMLPIIIVACILVGVIWHMHDNKPAEPVVIYRLPDHTADDPDRTNTGRSPMLPSNQPTTTVLVEPTDIQPPEEFVLLDKVVTQQMGEESLKEHPVVEPQQDNIGDIKELTEVSTPEPEFHITLGEVAESSGLSESQLEEITDVLPIDLNVNIASEEFMAMMVRVEKVIDREMYEIMESAAVDFGRELVQSFKDDPELNDEGIQLLIDEYLPTHITDALRKEGVLQ